MSWADAHRLAVVATVRLLRDLGLEQQPRIPIFEIPERLGIVLRAGPLPRLAGAYVTEAGSLPGILVNNRHPAARQRYTVAHEIGHHVLGHATSLDAETELDQAAGSTVPDHERMAEAFAAWLLMPRRTVLAQIERLCCDATTPAGAYQTSLALGASYPATVRQLANLRVVDRATAAELLKVVPATIKRVVMGEPHIGVGAADVHLIGASPETGATVGADDLVVVSVAGAVSVVELGGLGEVVDVLPAEGGRTRVRMRVRPVATANPSALPALHDVTIVVNDGEVKIPITVEPPRHGVPEVWF
jgi:hypothetical protein